MSQESNTSLDDSWIVNDTDDGDASWTGDDTLSDDEPVKYLGQVAHRPSPSQASKVTRHVDLSEPQFIMPSIPDTSVQPRQRVVPRKQLTSTAPARDSKLRTSSARGTPSGQRQVGREEPELTSRALAIVGSLLQALFDIIKDALILLKKPISWIVAGYAVLAFIQLSQNVLTNSFYSALSPICRIPGTSLLGLPFCRSYNENHPRLSAGANAPDPEFDALMQVQGQFESIMEDTATGLSLPMDMKRSETSIRDLRQVVRFSQLPSKHELMHEFDGFVETARIASYDLQKFNSHVGRGVDIVLSTARWTQRVLDDINHEQDERGLLPAFISDTLLAPFKPLKFTESRLLDQYIQHTHVVSAEIEKLIEEAQALLQTLQNLEDRLEVIHSISIRDGLHAQGTKDEILADIWTYIGGNRAKKQKVDNQIKLLAQVARYRKSAFNHIANTIIKLQSMGAELEELRSRVGSAATLEAAGAKNVPLQVHITNIQLGVERLEIGRERARELEQKQTRRIMDRTDDNSDIRFIDAR